MLPPNSSDWRGSNQGPTVRSSDRDGSADESERVTRNRLVGALAQEVEVAPLIGLQHALEVEGSVAASIFRAGRLELCLAGLQLAVRHQQIDPAGLDVELDQVPGLDQPEGAADRRFWRDVQDDGSKGRPAHARVRDADHVGDAGSKQ